MAQLSGMGETIRLTYGNVSVTLSRMAKTIGSNIAVLRETLGKSQLELAVACQIGRSAVSLIESDRRSPSWMTLRRIRAALGVEWAVLLNGVK